MAKPSPPAISAKLSLKCRTLVALLDETFISISSLREVLLGEPRRAVHDAQTEVAQEKVITREFKKLSELNHRYKWQGDYSCTEASQTGTSTPVAFSDRWMLDSEGSLLDRHGGDSIASLKLELQNKDAEIRNLTATVERLVAKKEKLERRVRKLTDRKKQGHGAGIATLSSNCESLKEEHHAGVAQVGKVDEKVASLCRPSENGVFAMKEQVKVPTASPLGKGGKEARVLSQAEDREGIGNSESPPKDMRHHPAKTGAIASEKLSSRVSEKGWRQGGNAEALLERQVGSELRRVVNGTIAEVTETLTEFCKAVVVHMKRAKWDVEEGGVDWVTEGHKALAVQSYVCMRMFRGFEHEDFYMSGRLSWLLDPVWYREECKKQFDAMVQMVEEPLDVLAGIAPDSAFGQFCQKKFLQIFPAPMEEALLGDLRHRDCLLQKAAHPHWSRFYQAFVRMAKAVWMLHKLAFSLEPRVSVFQAERGADFSASFMESHIPNLELASDTHNLLPKVAFTVMPGLRRGEQVFFRCRVYLNGMKASSPTSARG